MCVLGRMRFSILLGIVENMKFRIQNQIKTTTTYLEMAATHFAINVLSVNGLYMPDKLTDDFGNELRWHR